MFLAMNAPAKNIPPNRKKLLGEEFSGANVPSEKFFGEECSHEEYSDEELS
jgi:hypothetical protein